MDTLLPRIDVLGEQMAYRSAGDPDAPITLFLHGNPTSSYIWRDILPLVAPVARAIAPDLIGFGQSGKPALDYSFIQHAAYLDAFIDELGIESAYLVAQDWGTALAFHLAARRPDFVRGLVFMEFIRPMPSWSDFHQSDQARELFQSLRSPAGERLILEQNIFVERVLPGSIERPLLAEELDTYRTPFVTSDSRRPTLAFPRQLPIGGEPADVTAMLSIAHDALRASVYPKLVFAGDPGALLSPQQAREFVATLTNVELVQLPGGRHYLQEDFPQLIGNEVARWIRENEAP
ncbi:haloalkane dehalogenase [Nocardia testacea]|uniref:haloalkane dehalogenase n=1 Tax=Nocardia testacea TaxID=248551 RepID=UPI0002FCB5F8|nr:haloalkane dehalogenase [Nocardia testacea]